jgi:hypothetical protein
MAPAKIAAVRSDPPLPSVVVDPSGAEAMNPVTTDRVVYFLFVMETHERIRE